MRVISLPLHTFLFAAYPVLFLYHYNIEQVSPRLLPVPLLALLFSSFVLLLVLKFVLKDLLKASLVLSIFLILFFSFGHFHEAVMLFLGASKGQTNFGYFLLFYGLLFVCGTYPVINAKRGIEQTAVIFNVVALALVGLTAAQIVKFEVLERGGDAKGEKKLASKDSESLKALPDIYYIVLDEYGGRRILRELHGYGNKKFIDFLGSQGFYVVSRGHSNYTQTELSLASSLNMRYLDDLSEPQSYNKRVNLGRLVQENEVARFLKSKGYKFINFSSGIGSTDYIRGADENIFYLNGLNEFTSVLMQTSLLKIFYSRQFSVKRLRILKVFAMLARQSKLPGPKFVLAHIPAPHPPNVFGRNGEVVTPDDTAMQSWQHPVNGYIDELIFINKKTKVLLKEILKNSETVPVIIVQADHGPAFTHDKKKFSVPLRITMKERTGILNAYFVPGRCRERLYDSITPVNSFRLVFSCIFGADYKLLPDRVYWSWYNTPFELKDVTRIVAD